MYSLYNDVFVLYILILFSRRSAQILTYGTENYKKSLAISLVKWVTALGGSLFKKVLEFNALNM